MKEIIITEKDYATASARAMLKLRDCLKENDASFGAFAEMMLEFTIIQNCIFNELFGEEEKKYA